MEKYYNLMLNETEYKTVGEPWLHLCDRYVF